MGFGGKKKDPQVVNIQPNDPTGWIIDSNVAEFIMLHAIEIKYMAMLGYTFLHGTDDMTFLYTSFLFHPFNKNLIFSFSFVY